MHRLKLAMVVLVLALMACINSTPTPTPVPRDFIEKDINGSEGTHGDEMVVICNQAPAGVNIPPGSFTGTQPISVQCVNPNGSEAKRLEDLVSKKTNSTGEVLGAVILEPSPFKFNKNVTLVIPLFSQRLDLAGQTTAVYYSAPNQPDLLDYVEDALISNDGWRATATKVDHFSTFVLVERHEEGATETPPTVEPPTITPRPIDTPTITVTVPTPYVCGDRLGCVSLPSRGPISIEGVLSVGRVIGRESARGVEMAIKDRNGVISGHPIKFDILEDDCSSETGAFVGQTIISDPSIVAVIGTTCSRTALDAMPALNKYGLTMISPSNSSPRLSNPADGWLPGYYRTYPSDIEQAKLAATFAIKLGRKKAAIIYNKSNYGEAMLDNFASQFKDLGGEIPITTIMDAGKANYDFLLKSFYAGDVDVVYLAVDNPNDGGSALSYLFDYTHGEIQSIGTDVLFSQSFANETGSGATNLYVTSRHVQGGKLEEFSAKYYDNYGVVPEDLDAAFAYDAAMMLFDAIEKIATTDNTDTLYIGRQALQDTLNARRNFPGITGFMTCSTYGDCASPSALGVYQFTTDVVFYGKWPPPIVYAP